MLAFAVALLSGVSAGNSFWTVLSRALIAMTIALFISQAVTWAGKLALRDHLQRKKYDIDHGRVSGAEGDPRTPTNATTQAS
ncbi:MAG: hypothetical protein KDA32_11955 [Phycisphaerales bacterium]|nr:hypothetical protein [Phycisphaerales bacterium]